MKMKNTYLKIVLVLVLCIQNAISENHNFINSVESFHSENSELGHAFTEDNSEEESNYNENIQHADCKCDKGKCVLIGGKQTCTCPTEFGVYKFGSTVECRPCNCGKESNCTIYVTWLSTTITCLCKKGYKVVKSSCVGPCTKNPCKNGGTCADENETFKCICPPGFIGKNCEEKDPCTSNPCGSRGKCNIDGKTFKCACIKPYSGKQCEIDPCSSNPCNKRGKCSVVGDGFKCDCNKPYYGKQCEKVDPCSSNPCQKNGTCSIDGTNFKCNCTKPYFGKQCEKDPCTNKPCLNNGSCTIGKIGYICSCKPPFSGKSCENDPCTEKPCKNGGTCKVDGKRFKCDCKSPYSGITCEQDACTSNPCKNDGICKPKGNSFLCTCKQPYSGNTCEISPCTKNPCKNGGTCKVDGTSFKCNCTSPYSGNTCEEDPCSKRPCKNGGTCKLDGKSFKCNCKAPFSGSICEEDSCTKKPCKNGGTCKVDGLTFKCECKAPYSGKTCEEKCSCDNGECQKDMKGNMQCVCPPQYGKYTEHRCKECKCGPGANCTFSPDFLEITDGKKCICPFTFKESNGYCEDACTKNPCKNDGTCKPKGNSFECSCKQPYFGDTCEKNPCTKNPCLNNGTCSVYQNSYKCDCKSPYSGKTCTEDPCTAKPCKNGGTCKVIGISFKCECKEPYSGKTCETKCTCENGRCITDSEGTAHCTCPPEFGKYATTSCQACKCGKGANCTFDPGFFSDGKKCVCPFNFKESDGICEDACTNSPCKNGGTCQAMGNTYKCTCKVPYSGDICEKDPCASNPCKHNGKCTIENNDFKCICSEPFYGSNCDQECICKKGVCKKANSNNDLQCFCPPEHGLTEGGVCEECNCGENANCTFKRFILGFNKTCICPKGYAENNGSCKEIQTTTVPAFTPVRTIPPTITPNIRNITDEFNQTTVIPSNFTRDFNETTYIPSNFSTTTYVPTNFTSSFNETTYIPTNFTSSFNETTYVPTNFTSSFNETTYAPSNFTYDFNGTTYKPTNFTQNYNETTYVPSNFSTTTYVPANFTSGFNETTYVPSNFTYDFNGTTHEPTNFTRDFNITTDQPSNFTHNFNETTYFPSNYTSGFSETTFFPTNFTTDFNETTDGSSNTTYSDIVTQTSYSTESTAAPTNSPIFSSTTQEPGPCKDYCKNGGSCKVVENSPQCICPYPFGGKTCEGSQWCEEGDGKAMCPEDSCVFNFTSRIGRCACAKDQYFNYEQKMCEVIDMCAVGTKICSGKYEMCKNGNCECQENFKRNDKKECVPKFCEATPYPCSENELCEEISSDPGNVKCTCKEGFIFDGQTCIKSNDCTLPSTLDCHQVCNSETQSCECKEGFTLQSNNKTCVLTNPANKCKKACGVGVCVKAEKGEICVCPITHISRNTCIDLCAAKSMPKGMCPNDECVSDSKLGYKCKCEGKFILSQDGVTCRRRLMCSEGKGSEICKKRKGHCVEDIKNEEGFRCDCKAEEEHDTDGVCTYKCSLKKYREKCSKLLAKCEMQGSEPICRCPPMLTFNKDNGKCTQIAQASFIANLPITLHKNNLFTTKNDDVLFAENNGFVIDLARTGAELRASMISLFGQNYQFAEVWGCTVTSEKMTSCFVELQFRKDPKDQVNLISDPNICISIDADTCFIPPELVLTKKDIKPNMFTATDPCMEYIKERNCGKETDCKKINNETNNFQCTCAEGFRSYGYYQPFDDERTIIDKCEDINECLLPRACPNRTRCFNTYGSYTCPCLSGFRPINESSDPKLSGCVEICNPKMCGHGKCEIKGDKYRCQCDAGYGGSSCDVEEHLTAGPAGMKTALIILSTLVVPLMLLSVYMVYQYQLLKKKTYGNNYLDDTSSTINLQPLR